MAVEVEVTMTGVEAAASQFKAVADRAKNMRPVFLEFGEKWKVLSDEQVFGSFQSPQGNSWAQMADSTQRRHPTGILMQRTEALKEGIAATPSNTSLVLGVTGDAEPYAGFHMKGTRHMPRRAVLPLSASGAAEFDSGPAKIWRDELEAAMVNYLLTGSTS